MLPMLFGVAGFIVAVVVILLVCAFGPRGPRKTFEEQYPPISDAEFVARCSPGTSPEVALKVRRIVAKHFGIEYERIHPSTRFVDDIGAE